VAKGVEVPRLRFAPLGMTEGMNGAGGWSVGAGAGVGLVVDLAEAAGGDVGVDLGGAEAGVAEELLDGAEVGAVFQ